jgi:hypothetical protein
MNFLERLMTWAMKPQRPKDPEAEEARDIANRISQRADELTAKLETYQRARDPFAALMADMYNRDQLSRLHRSNKP